MEPATSAATTAALSRVSVWPPDLDPDDRYRPLTGLDVDAYARAICRRLGDPPLRVGRSAVVMGVASRLWSLTIVPAIRDRLLPDPAGLVVREDDGAIVLGVRATRGWRDPEPADLRSAVLGVLEPLVDRTPLADRLLWGNVAASLHAVPRVHHLPEAAPLVEVLLSAAPLAGELDVAGATARRRTCCLFYEVPGAGLCGDCVFDNAPAVSTSGP